MKNTTKKTTRKIAALYATHNRHWVSDFPVVSSLILAATLSLLVIGAFTQVDVGAHPDSWVLFGAESFISVI